MRDHDQQPNGVVSNRARGLTQPSWGWRAFTVLSQGSAVRAILGWRPESRWDAAAQVSELAANAKVPLPLSEPPANPARPRSARGLAHSKTCRAFLASLLFLVAACGARAQSCSIDWSKVAGGGGTSTGGVYAVSGTIGQPDAGGPLANGQYSVTGGFWVLPIVVQTSNAPTLKIVPAAPGFATVSWTPPTPGFTLQSSASLSPASWVGAPSGTNNPVTVPATSPARFYRLLKANP